MQEVKGVIINKLTLAQYKELKANNNLQTNESYVITDIDEQLDNLITYKESLDVNNPIILRTLNDGLYKIYGYFKFNASQSGISGASPFCLVSIAQGNGKTYAQIIDYTSIANYEITDSTYKSTDDTGWMELEIASGLTPYNATSYPVRYRKIKNKVIIEGAVKGITAKNKVIATIPSGFRPTKNKYYLNAGASGKANTYEIRSNGSLVFINTTSTATLNASDYYFIDIEYYID